MPQRLADLASHVGGELHGNGELMISRVASLESAGAGDISFITAPRFRPALAACHASAVILAPALKDATDLPRLVCKDPYLAYARVAQLFSPAAAPVAGIHPTAVIEVGAQIASGAAIGAGVFIGRDSVIGEGTRVGAGTSIGAGSRVGSGCLLHARVTLYQGCAIGDRCIIHSGAVIGADGFGFAPDKGTWLKIPQTGGVRIGDDVEIGANTTIDRGALDDTVIENGVKLDNQIQVAHNVRIGAHTVIAAMTGIAGSARIGSHCLIGGAVRIMGHISIADGVEIGATTFVSKSINAPGKYSGGVPFAATSAWLKNEAWMKNLDKLAQRLKALEQRVLERKPGDRQKRD